jgi:hypothetical protein
VPSLPYRRPSFNLEIKRPLAEVYFIYLIFGKTINLNLGEEPLTHFDEQFARNTFRTREIEANTMEKIIARPLVISRIAHLFFIIMIISALLVKTGQSVIPNTSISLTWKLYEPMQSFSLTSFAITFNCLVCANVLAGDVLRISQREKEALLSDCHPPYDVLDQSGGVCAAGIGEKQPCGMTQTIASCFISAFNASLLAGTLCGF